MKMFCLNCPDPGINFSRDQAFGETWNEKCIKSSKYHLFQIFFYENNINANKNTLYYPQGDVYYASSIDQGDHSPQ